MKIPFCVNTAEQQIESAIVRILALAAFSFPALVLAQVESAAGLTGQIIREAKCKVLIRGELNVSEGDVLQVSRRPGGQEASIGQVRVLKVTPNRITAQVLNARGDCRKFLAAFVSNNAPLAQGSAASSGGPSEAVQRLARQKRIRSGPPPLVRLVVGVGPGFSFSNLKGNSRVAVSENYQLVLTSFNAAGEVYPFAFSGKSGFAAGLGVEGLFRYVSSISDVRVSMPSPNSGQELDLDLAVRRTAARGGAVVRVPVWKERLFLDTRSGFYSNHFASTIARIVTNPDGDSSPLEISPLRDLGLSGVYALGGFQFHPSNTFRSRVNAGTVLNPNFQIDNRVQNAAANSQRVNAQVQSPTVFLLDASVAYVLKKVQLGVDISVESFSGQAFFPDGQSQGPVSEAYNTVGLSVAFLL